MRLRTRAVGGLVALVAGAGCAGDPPPWHVRPGEQERFAETKRVCRMLTDDPEQRLHPQRFEACMERRGWRRQGLLRRLLPD